MIMETKKYFVKMEDSFILVTAPSDLPIESVTRSILNNYDGRMTEIWDTSINPEDGRLNYIDKEILMFRDSLRRPDMLEVVDEFPPRYVVWNIGRQNFPYESYVPIARDLGGYRCDMPRCIKVKDEELALSIMHKAAHCKGFIDRYKFKDLCEII